MTKVRLFFRYLWTPTDAPPQTRSRFNLLMHRFSIASLIPGCAIVYATLGWGGLVLMLLSYKTDIATAYGNVQVGDVREQGIG